MHQCNSSLLILSVTSFWCDVILGIHSNYLDSVAWYSQKSRMFYLKFSTFCVPTWGWHSDEIQFKKHHKVDKEKTLETLPCNLNSGAIISWSDTTWYLFTNSTNKSKTKVWTHTKTHTSPSWANHVVCTVRIVEEINGFTTTPRLSFEWEMTYLIVSFFPCSYPNAPFRFVVMFPLNIS